jgi:hypothetical protein
MDNLSKTVEKVYESFVNKLSRKDRMTNNETSKIVAK